MAIENYNFTLPAINATWNFLALIFLILGFVQIKKSNVKAHKKLMLIATFCSAAFLSCYLYYHFNFSSPKFSGTGVIRYIYYTILISHIFLSVLILPFIFRLLWLGFKQKNTKHKKLARIVWPIWVYNSVSGIFIYLMLYQIYTPKLM